MSHQAQISRNSPTAFLFVVDQSGSMADKMSSGRSKAEFVVDALNRTLMNLIGRCTKSEGVRDYFDVGVIGYGGSNSVDNGFKGSLGGKFLHPISAIEPGPVRVERGRYEPVRGRGLGQRDRMPHADRLAVDVDRGVEAEAVRPSERVRDVEDRRARHTCRCEHVVPLRR